MDNKSQADYDAMDGAVEHPDDAKPISIDALKARKRAIREGRLIAPARSTLPASEKVLLPLPETDPAED